jgi:hypothetical protein
MVTVAFMTVLPAAAATAAPAARQAAIAAAACPISEDCGSGFHLVNFHSGLCLGITSGLDDAPAVQWTCNGNPDQLWHWGSPLFPNVPDSDLFQLVNGDGECLGVASGSENEGAQIVGWSCLGQAHRDQYWEPGGNSCGGQYTPLTNAKSGFVLGVTGNSPNVGASIVQWPFQGQCNNQYWWDPDSLP